MAAFKLSRGTESKVFAMLKEAIQICLFRFLAILIEEDIIERDSIVLCPGRLAKLASDRILLNLIILASLLLMILVKIFLTGSSRAIGLVSVILWDQIIFFGRRQIEVFSHSGGMNSVRIILLNKIMSHFFAMGPRLAQAS